MTTHMRVVDALERHDASLTTGGSRDSKPFDLAEIEGCLQAAERRSDGHARTERSG
jgi:hypothetical protein